MLEKYFFVSCKAFFGNLRCVIGNNDDRKVGHRYYYNVKLKASNVKSKVKGKRQNEKCKMQKLPKV